MKRKICATLLSLCSLVWGAERKSDASIIGKALKYGSAAVVAVGHLATISGSVYIYRNRESLKKKVETLESAVSTVYSAKNLGKTFLNLFTFNDEEKEKEEKEEKEKEKNVKEILSAVKSWIPNKLILIVNSLALLVDVACYDVYRLGQYLDGDFNKSNANQEKNSCKEKGKSRSGGDNVKNDSNGAGSNNPKSVKA